MALFFEADDTSGTNCRTTARKGTCLSGHQPTCRPSLYQLTNVSGTLFFTDGYELWKATARKEPCWSGHQQRRPVHFRGYFTNVGGTLFFQATDGNNYELWKLTVPKPAP
jgi:hypothetical protein